MRRPVQLEVMRRLIDAIEAPSTATSFEATPLSVHRYLDGEQYENELTALFHRQPVIVAHISDLPEKGSFVSEDIAGLPVLAVRDGEGKMRVFVNACRHRGARLVDEARGCQKALTCRYHAWSYDLAGRLLHVPHEELFGSKLKPAERGLRELPSEVRHGFLWARLDGAAAPEVASALGPEPNDDLGGFELTHHHAHHTVTHLRQANWKLVMDAFAEGYHLKALHQTSLARFFREETILDDWAPHVRQVGARKTLAEAAKQPESSWDLRELTTVFYNVFPNIVFVVHPDWITQMSLFPEAVDRVRVVHRMLVRHRPETEEQAERLDKSFALIDGEVFQKEDLAIAESIQCTVGSKTDREFLLGGMETGMRLFHEARDRALAALGESTD